MSVEISFDPAKNLRNIRERNLPFERAIDFDFQSAILTIDSRRDYGETRYVAVGYFDGRLHVLCFTETPAGIRGSVSEGPMPEKPNDMRDRKPLTNDEGEVRELLTADFADFHPAAELLPQSLAEKIGVERGRADAASTRIRVSLRLSRDVIERFRAAEGDWEARLDAALREWLEAHPAV
jgi:uncharacterized protein